MAYNEHLFYSHGVRMVWLIQAGLGWARRDSRLQTEFRSVSSLPGTYCFQGGPQKVKRERTVTYDGIYTHSSDLALVPLIPMNHLHMRAV